MKLKYGSVLAGSKGACEGKTSAVVYVGGCPFRCGYCFSAPIIIAAENCAEMEVEQFASYFEQQKAGIEAVVFTGGEPLQQHEPLTELCRLLKQKGFFVKLETSGFYADALEKILEFVDYVALDVKHEIDAEKYNSVVNFRGEPAMMMQEIYRALVILREAKKKTPSLFVECRTTIVPGMNDSLETVGKIAKECSFADQYVLQQFLAEGSLIDPTYLKRGDFPKQKLVELAAEAAKHARIVKIRGREGEQLFEELKSDAVT